MASKHITILPVDRRRPAILTGLTVHWDSLQHSVLSSTNDVSFLADSRFTCKKTFDKFCADVDYTLGVRSNEYQRIIETGGILSQRLAREERLDALEDASEALLEEETKKKKDRTKVRMLAEREVELMIRYIACLEIGLALCRGPFTRPRRLRHVVRRRPFPPGPSPLMQVSNCSDPPTRVHFAQ